MAALITLMNHPLNRIEEPGLLEPMPARGREK